MRSLHNPLFQWVGMAEISYYGAKSACYKNSYCSKIFPAPHPLRLLKAIALSSGAINIKARHVYFDTR